MRQWLLFLLHGFRGNGYCFLSEIIVARTEHKIINKKETILSFDPKEKQYYPLPSKEKRYCRFDPKEEFTVFSSSPSKACRPDVHIDKSTQETFALRILLPLLEQAINIIVSSFGTSDYCFLFWNERLLLRIDWVNSLFFINGLTMSETPKTVCCFWLPLPFKRGNNNPFCNKFGRSKFFSVDFNSTKKAKASSISNVKKHSYFHLSLVERVAEIV